MDSKKITEYALILFLVHLMASCTISVNKGSETDKEEAHEIENSEANASAYDSILAAEYGADDYGMKKYVIAFLKRGPNQDLDSTKKAELQMAHLENINRLAEEGKLVLAGPFFGNDDLRGIYVFDAQSIEEAKKLTETDPAIKEQTLVMELKEWYGSAALMGLNEAHLSIMKKDVTD